MNLSKTIDEIMALSHFREFNCSKCGVTMRVHALEIQVRCPKCMTVHKCRAFDGIDTEIQDVIDAVLEWAGEGENLEAVMTRHRVILQHKDD
jgi:hypothetical protein